ncbi:hypothetical protein [Guggenheimella bovis]
MEKIEEGKLQTWHWIFSFSLTIYLFLRLVLRFTVDQMDSARMLTITSDEWRIFFFSDPVMMILAFLFTVLIRELYSQKRYELSTIFTVIMLVPLFLGFRFQYPTLLPIPILVLDFLALKWYRR